MKQVLLLVMSFALTTCANSTLPAVEQPADKLAMVQARAARYGIATKNQSPKKCAT